MFFTKNNPTYEDVITFCEKQIPEGIHLDYKKDMSSPAGIAKTICAFANTQGGTIIVGVEDENNKPKLPVAGTLEHNKGLGANVVNIILDHIYNPVIPEIHVCDPSSEGKTFIIIKVPESNNAPHALDKDSSVYIRTNDVSRSERVEVLSDIKRIEWLLERRKRSENFREELKSSSTLRYNEIKTRVQGFEEPLINITGIPLYPFEPLIKVEEIQKIISSCITHGYSESLPAMMDQLQVISVPNGIINDYKNYFHYFCELNQFGLFNFIKSVEDQTPYVDASNKIIFKQGGSSLHDILSTIDLYLESLGKFYSQLNFYGLIELTISIDLKNKTVNGLGSVSFPSQVEANTRVPLDNIYYRKVLNFSDLTDKRESVICDISQTICWNVGFKTIDIKKIEGFFRSNNRLS